MLNSSSDDKNATSRLEQVINAINSKDREAVKVLFSETALNETDDIDEKIELLFSFVLGTINSWEKSSGPTVFETNHYGKKTKEVSSYYYVTTDKQEYFFLLRDFPIDTDNPENVGLYMLLVVKAEDREKIYDRDNKIIYDGDMKLSHAGVYLPIQ